MKGIQRIAVIALILAGIAVVLCGCNRQEKLSEQTINYRLKWLFNVSVVGDLYADVHGIFKSHGFSVAVKSGGPERDALKELEMGRAQFGVASADQVIRALDKGAPIVVVAQLFQVNPLQWLYRKDQNAISTPADLKNKIIGITFGGNDETIMRALLKKQKIQQDEVTLFSVRYDYTPLYQAKVDLWPVYRNAEGIVLAEKFQREDESVGFFDPNAFSIDFVANSVVTTRQMVQEHPETVEKFVNALLQGWREALDPANAEKAVETVSEYDQETPREIIEKQLAVTRELMRPPEGKPFGWIDVSAWKETERIMLDQELIGGPVGVEKSLQQVAE